MKITARMTASVALLALSMGSALAQDKGNQTKAPAPPGLALMSPAFKDGDIIPDKYTQSAGPAAISPKLEWTNVPNGTVTFALILHDPDVAMQKKTDDVLHWMAFNIPGSARELAENVPASSATLPDGTVQAKNLRGGVGFMGPGARSGRALSSLHLRVVCPGYQARLGPRCHARRRVECDARSHSGQRRVGGPLPPVAYVMGVSPR